MLHVHHYKVRDLRKEKKRYYSNPSGFLTTSPFLYSHFYNIRIFSELYKITATLGKRYLKRDLRVREQNIDRAMKGDTTSSKQEKIFSRRSVRFGFIDILRKQYLKDRN